jgi:glucosyl-dolichyl phosphate glucuronosyltransferase
LNLTVAIPTFNDDPAIFARVLDLVAERAPGVPVVVVDMSTHDRVARVCDGRAGVEYHPYPESGGVSHSRNRCLEVARTRYVTFLDSDAFPDPGWVDAQRRRLDDDGVAVVGSRILAAWEAPPPRLMHAVTASDWLSLFDIGDRPVEVPRIVGTSYAVDRERLPDPPFDESLGRRPGWPLAMEENALCEAVRDAGWRVFYEPASVVRHNIPADRASWRWMWRRAHAAGRETRAAGRFEPIPRPALTLRDRAFQAAVAVPFALGVAAETQSRRNRH